ncbi:hypothetical protein [Rhodoplanes elegans]|nr:hypothetical protein [Rhodoplanes elegans]
MHKTYRFSGGKLEAIERPDWIKPAFDGDIDLWHAALSSVGLIRDETFGDAGHTLEVHKHYAGHYYVEYWDASECVIEVHIANPADYITFRAQYISPLAMLIMKSDEHDAWLDERRPDRQR